MQQTPERIARIIGSGKVVSINELEIWITYNYFEWR